MLHRHIYVVLHRRYANLLRDDYNKVVSWVDLPTIIRRLRHDHNWSEEDFMWAYNESNNSKSPMIYYAKEFTRASKGKGMNQAEQIADLVSYVSGDHHKVLEKIPKMCRDLRRVYYK